MEDSNAFPSSMSLHESLACGDYERALSTPADADTDPAKKNEMLRLPLLLRLLSSSQHLATLNSIVDDEDEEKDEEDAKMDHAASSSENGNDFVTTIVQLLEQVAARHACAENIEVFSHLAPELCRPVAKHISRPLKRKRRLITVGSHEEKEVVLGKGVVVTDRLETGGQSVATSGWYDEFLKEICGKSKHDDDRKAKSSDDIEDIDLIEGDDDDDNDDDDDHSHKEEDKSVEISSQRDSKEEESNDRKRIRKSVVSVLDTALLEKSDTLESTVCKILLELLNLVASSLKPIQASTRALILSGSSNEERNADQDRDAQEDDAGKEEEFGQDRPDSVTEIKLKPDSLLSETSLGSIYDSELSAIITSLMHYTPILRHEHVANALCRTSIPQCAEIVRRLAANCSIASGSLVRGCIDACRIAEICNDGENKDVNMRIIDCAKESVEAIAALSTREAMYVAGVLRQSCIMPDVLIRVMIANNADCAVSLIFSSIRDCVRNDHHIRTTGNSGHLQVRNRDSLYAAFRSQVSISAKVLGALREDSDLVALTRSFLISHISQLHANVKGIIWGQMAMVVQTLGMLVQKCGGGSLNEIEKCCQLLFDVVKCVDYAKTNLQESNRSDEFIKSALATLITICSTYLSTPGANESACESYFTISQNWAVSRRSESFVSRIRQLIVCSEINCLQIVLHSILFTETQSINPTKEEDAEIAKFCKWASHLCTDAESNDSAKDIMSMIEMGKCNSVSYDTFSLALDQVLNDPILSSKIYHDKHALVFIETAISKLMNKGPPYVPAVLPLSIQSKCRKMLNNFKCLDADGWQQFLVHLVYAFSFLLKFPKSPFCIIPSSLPLKEIVSRVYLEPASAIGGEIDKFVKYFCPEVLQQCLDRLPKIQDGVELEFDVKLIKPASVARAVQDMLSIEEDSPSSAYRKDMERLYLASRASFPSNEVDVEVASMLLKSVEESFHFMSYTNLVKDPLVLLKCSIKVWTNDTLRRILLCIFNRALVANEAAVAESASAPEVASEYLASRDVLFVRCFLFLLSGCYNSANKEVDGECDDCSINCPIMLSMVRHAVAKHGGLAASLIRQGLPFNASDWFIQNVPEIFVDANELTAMLESRTLTVVEKLQISDGALRMSILYGLDDAPTQRLVYNALSVLVSSFYLVVGPVGVPVNILSDEQGRDITQTYRVVMFRMLGVLGNIGSENKSLRHEAILSLSKIANLCKSDGAIGGLKGIALKKRKTLLTEVWDALVKANESFGGGAQL